MSNVTNQSQAPDTFRTSVYPFIFFGLFLISYVVFCLFNSTPECIYYFGKGGLIENCSTEKDNAYINLAVATLMGILFCSLGLLNLIKKKKALAQKS